MYQPNDPNRQQPGHPYPQQPPPYPELKPLPPNWQKPIQPQWNPNGVYGGAPEPQKPFPVLPIAFTVIGIIFGIGLILFIILITRQSSNQPTLVPTASNAVVAQRPTLVPTKAYPTATTAVLPVTTKPVVIQQPTPTEQLAPTPTVPPTVLTLAINSYRFTKDVETRTPKSGFTYFIVDFSVSNKSNLPIYVSPSYFSVQSKDAFSYEYVDVTYLLTKGFKSTTLSPGETTRGEVAFEVPSNDVLISGRFEDIPGNKITMPIN